MGMDPHWVEFYPYKVRAEPGSELRFDVRIRNHESQARDCRVVLRASGGATVLPDAVDLHVAAKTDTSTPVVVSLPQTRDVHAWTIVADVTWNGRSYGELAEAIVWW